MLSDGWIERGDFLLLKQAIACLERRLCDEAGEGETLLHRACVVAGGGLVGRLGAGGRDVMTDQVGLVFPLPRKQVCPVLSSRLHVQMTIL